MGNDDYYHILGVSKNATQDEIKRAYREMALKYHPDRNKSKEAEETFKKINEAYAVLSNPEKRKQYDTLGDYQFEHKFSQEDIFSGFNFEKAFRDAGLEDEFDVLSSLFGVDLLKHSRMQGFNNDVKKSQRKDINGVLSLTKKEMINGCYKKITIEHEELCPKCNGLGVIRSERHLGNHVEIISTTCDVCGGERCVHKKMIISMRIPSKSYENKILRLKGMGDCGGDMYIRLNEKK